MMDDRPVSRRQALYAAGGALFAAAVGRSTLAESTALRKSTQSDSTNTERRAIAETTSQGSTTATKPNDQAMQRTTSRRTTTAEPPSDGAVVDTFDSFQQDWTTTSGIATTQSDVVYHGDQSVRMDSAGENRLRIQRTFDEPRDFTGRDFSLAVYLESTSKASVEPQILLEDERGNHQFRSGSVSSLATDCWTRIDTGVESDDDLDPSAVTSIAIGEWVGEREARYVVDDLQTRAKPETGHVVFSFDDSHGMDYTLAYPTLSRYGFQGAFFPPIASVTAESDPSTAEYREMAADGWDVGGHTLHHERLPNYSKREQREILRENRDQLRRKGFERGTGQFRTTRGSYDTATLDVVPEYFETCIVPQGSATGTAVRSTDPFTIGYKGGDDYEHTKDLIDAAVEYRQLLGLTLHMKHVEDPAAFESVVEYVHEYVDAGDLRVVTPSTVHAEFGGSTG